MESKSNKQISVFILFYAFGYTNDKEIVDMCCMNNQEIRKFV